MMRAMRENTKWIFYILALAFIGWLVFDVGMGVTGKGQYGGQDPVVIKVDGQEIRARQWDAARTAAVEQYRQRNNINQLTQEDQRQIEDQLVEQLTREILIQHEYRRLGITVTDEELREAILNSPPPDVMRVPEFQTNGQFDIQKWRTFVTSGRNQDVVLQLEANYRDQIYALKWQRYVTADLYVSDPKLWRVYRDTHDSVAISLVAIGPETIADSTVPVSDAELQDFYASHKKDYKRAARALMSFVALPKEPNPADTAAARARAQQVRTQVATGGQAHFIEVAKTESADTVSGRNGGDLGWVKRNEQGFDSLFMKGMRATPVGQVSPPVLSQFGFHLIRVEAVKGDSLHVRHILIPIELTGAHRDSVESQADTLDRIASEHDTGTVLDAAAAVLHVPVARALPLRDGDRMLLGRYVVPNVSVWAFDHRPGQTSPLFEGEVAYYVFRLDSLIQEGIAPLADDSVRIDVTRRARVAKKEALWRQRAEQFAALAKSAASLQAAAQAAGLTAQRLGPFSRLTPPGILQLEPGVVGAAFGLQVGQRSAALVGEHRAFVIELVSRHLADSAAWLAQRDTQREQLSQSARQARIQAYVEALHDQARIVDHRKELQQAQLAAAGK